MSGDSHASKWQLPPHTRAKHEILARYLDGWFPVLGSTNGRIVFLDGFAGRGIYADGSPGSPIIALRQLLEHTYFPSLAHREFVFIFVEHDSSNVASLRQEIDKFRQKHQPWPNNVKYEVVESTFEGVADEIIDSLKEKQATMAPLLAFVDPFGFQGLPLAKLAELTAWPRAEVCINFAANNVNRFLLEDSVQAHIEELFGCAREEVIADWDGNGVRLPHLRKVYGEQLSKHTGLDYVQSFEMRNSSGNVSYYLYHATRHSKGVELMKNAMWKIDPAGRFSFSDRLAGLEVLFSDEPDLSPLRKHLFEEFGNRGSLDASVVKEHVNLHTPYRAPHLTSVLRELEKEGSLGVVRSGKSRTGYALGTQLKF